MRDQFSEYYQIPDTQLSAHWKNDIFCFDANVLLNLYRYTPATRKAFFDLLGKIKDRIFIPYQAAFEYHKNRLIVISAQKTAYKDIRETLLKKKNEIEAKLNEFKKHPYLRSGELTIQIESAFDAIGKDLDKLEKDHPDYLAHDPVCEELTLLLHGKIGDDFSTDDLEKAYREGKKRYDEKIPPGYMDFKEKQNEGNRSLYGDVILWKQVISKAKGTAQSIILVTDDLKEDWWYKFKGKTISPRPELIKEFKNETQKRINIYRADTFLEMANKNLAQQTTKEAILEIRDIRLADEQDILTRLKERFSLANMEEIAPENDINKGSTKSTAFEQAISDLADENRT
jgi:hypothetical protein